MRIVHGRLTMATLARIPILWRKTATVIFGSEPIKVCTVTTEVAFFAGIRLLVRTCPTPPSSVFWPTETEAFGSEPRLVWRISAAAISKTILRMKERYKGSIRLHMEPFGLASIRSARANPRYSAASRTPGCTALEPKMDWSSKSHRLQSSLVTTSVISGWELQPQLCGGG